MALFTKSLWPGSVRAPYLRLSLAMVVVPLLLAGLLAFLAFLVGGLSEPDREAVLAYVLGILPYLFGGLLAFTLSFGLAGVLALWAFGQHSLVVWALVGAVMGVIAGGLMILSGSFTLAWPVLLGTGLLGWLMFVLIRAVAGIRKERERPGAG